jgi:hypothetical protein
MIKIDEFEHLTQQLKIQLSTLPPEKFEQLFRHHKNFSLLSYRHIKQLAALTAELPVERWQNFDDQLGTSALDFVLLRPQNLELLLTDLAVRRMKIHAEKTAADFGKTLKIPAPSTAGRLAGPKKPS